MSNWKTTWDNDEELLKKAEKREKLKNNRNKMIISNRSIFTLLRIKNKKLKKKN